MLCTTDVECIDLSKAMMYVLPFVSLMKEIKCVLKPQNDTPKVLQRIIKKPVTFHKDNQESIAFPVSTQMRARTKYTGIKYHHFKIFFVNGDSEIKKIYAKE